MKWKWFGFILLVIGLLVSLDLGKKIQQLLSEATGKKAEIVVNVDKTLGKLPRPWPHFSQGGESSDGMLKAVIKETSNLSPGYIRIDHIYDFYEVVRKENGSLVFNWAKLDQEVDIILATGAKPFLVLSYMPPALASGVTDKPDNWSEWQELVRLTIEHYSGKNAKNIDKVYYEVWNEPDLFGDWKTYGEKNYLDLYRASSQAANQAANVQSFKLGGPATTGMYRNWIGALFKLVNEENLRLDFVSWHRYTKNPEQFSQDIEDLTRLIGQYPKLVLEERIISEWGLDAENNPGYDTQLGAAHTFAGIREMLGKVSKAFSFEIKDGLDPEGKVFWGRYGLITHEKLGANLKPRYKVFQWLNQLGETRLAVTGEGSWVKAIAAKKSQTVQVYLVNYDSFSNHQESTPVLITGLVPGNYQLIKESFSGSPEQRTIAITGPEWLEPVLLTPNSLIRLSLTPLF